ncbi:DUF418 domain-containing protein [Hyalangium minutum]|uniref:DUF418 domain-containing protein n=1 Tax=Hyalangium minutum TaxID=394096 RepID=A0A085WP73_9BACT|nr:DUF418 domain-containing protein [Hyalangium minutum]APZ78694.1 uncharacterized protein [Hyalangium minutum]KFE69486.1 hypothetical protein DB31_6461 [Hyalangium minutum]
MPDTSNSSSRAGSDVHPIDFTERSTLIDALRGFALCGVLLSNSIVWFSGRALIPAAQAEALARPPLEKVVSNIFQLFVNQKFLTIFAFLFGLSFSLQLSRAEARGVAILPLYTRRLLVLLGFGVVHFFALWTGDILHTYALVGFLLLLFYRSSNRTLLTWCVVLLGVAPLLMAAGLRWGPVLLHGAEAANALKEMTQAQEGEQRAALLAALASDSFWMSQLGNARFGLELLTRPTQLLVLILTLGRFLLGLLAGRLGVLQDVERHRPWLRRIGWGGLVLGLLITFPGLVVLRLRNAGVWTPPDNLGMFLLNGFQDLGASILGVAFVSFFALIFQREWWRRVLSLLAPVGRMALTNYLVQTVVSLCIYDGWGLGLIGSTAVSRSAVFALGIFAVQVGMSHWWLKHFRFGPAEWLWRSLTYGRAQPLRHGARANSVVSTD